MKTRIVLVVAATAFGIVLTASSGLANVKVTPDGHISTLTDAQETELFNILVHNNHTPQEAQAIAKDAIIIDPKGASELVVTATEDQPGEILPCQVICVLGGVAQGTAETKRGDGSYNGPPSTVLQSSCGRVLDFHGIPSTNDPLKILFDLTMTQ